MSEDSCPICHRPDGAGHEPRCLEGAPTNNGQGAKEQADHK